MNAILFDLDDTLYLRSTPTIKAYIDVFNDRFKIDLNEFVKLNRKYDIIEFDKYQKGIIPIETLYRNRVIFPLKELGYEVSLDEADLFQARYTKYLGEIELAKGMNEVLDFGKDNNIFMGIITNGRSNRQRDKVKNLNIDNWISEDRVLVSEDLNISKPNPKIYEYYLNKHHLDKDNVVFVGDSYDTDIMGAINANIKAIWLYRDYVSKPKEIKNNSFIKVYDEKELLKVLKGILL